MCRGMCRPISVEAGEGGSSPRVGKCVWLHKAVSQFTPHPIPSALTKVRQKQYGRTGRVRMPGLAGLFPLLPANRYDIVHIMAAAILCTRWRKGSVGAAFPCLSPLQAGS
jgi:hypothetical protein